MEVKNATIVFIEKVNQKANENGKLIIDVVTDSTPKKRYIIWENKQKPRFDLLRQFSRGFFKVGDKINFNYNNSDENNFPTIWKMKTIYN